MRIAPPKSARLTAARSLGYRTHFISSTVASVSSLGKRLPACRGVEMSEFALLHISPRTTYRVWCVWRSCDGSVNIFPSPSSPYRRCNFATVWSFQMVLIMFAYASQLWSSQKSNFWAARTLCAFALVWILWLGSGYLAIFPKHISTSTTHVATRNSRQRLPSVQQSGPGSVDIYVWHLPCGIQH